MNVRTCLIAGVLVLFGMTLALLLVADGGAQVLPRIPPARRGQDPLVPGAKGAGRTDLIDDVPKPTGPKVAQYFAPQSPPALPRYQGAADGGHLYLFDTVTGEGWHARPGGNWEPSVRPVAGVKAVPVN